MNNSNTNIGKFLSLILRHNPSVIHITLDENGWADVEELMTQWNKSEKHEQININKLEHVVNNNNKKRFEFTENNTKIRARQGHSIKVDLNLDEKIPPEILYHGTAKRHIQSIDKEGLTKQGRQHVHLSSEIDTAKNVGKRHDKYHEPIILKIDALKMQNNGYKFYLSNNGVWLTDIVPSEYINKS